MGVVSPLRHKGEKMSQPEICLNRQLAHAQFQLNCCRSWLKVTPKNDVQAFQTRSAKERLSFLLKKVKDLKKLVKENPIAVARPFRVGHTFSMSYRIWYFGFADNVLKFRETHMGTEEDIHAYIENARAVRVDRRDSEYGWATIWLTGIEFLALQQGDVA